MSTNADDVAVAGVADTLAPLSVGKILSEARLSQGLSIADVAASIKFAPRQVEALEADDFIHLPELAFVRGFVRSYARLLHIDEKSLLDALPPAHQKLAGLKEDLPEVPFSTAQSNRRINVVWLSAALGLSVALGIGIWLFQDKPAEKKAAVVPVMVAPVMLAASSVEAAVDAASSVVASPLAALPIPPVKVKESKDKEALANNGGTQGAIHLVFEEDAWVDIKDKFGKTLQKQVNAANTEQWIKGRPPFSVVIGNASNVHLYYEDEEVDLDEFTDVSVARLILE